jgi:hypothetical protein
VDSVEVRIPPMTGQELASLPVGSIIYLDNEPGEVIRSGNVVEIMWPETNVTSIIETAGAAWQLFIALLKEEE